MSVVDLLFGDIAPVIVGLRATEYMLAACATLLTYDYFLTLDREIALVWPSRWSFGKVMFILNRYSPIIDTVLANFILQGVRNQGNCDKLVSAATWLYTTGALWSEIILTMRTCAIWGGNRYVLYFLVALITGLFISACILTQMSIQSIAYIPIPEFLIPILGLTCAPLPKHGEVWSEFVVLMIGEAVVATLALTRAFREYRLTHNALLGTMFHDGLLYYVYMLVLSIANVLVALLAPIQWGGFLELPLRVLNSIFCTRILLNIRGTYFGQSNNTNNTYTENGANSTSFKFQSRQGRGHFHSLSISDQENGSMTVETHDTVYYDETDIIFEHIDEGDEELSPSQGWTWSDPMQPPQLSLRPMTPLNFDIEMAELLRLTQPSP